VDDSDATFFDALPTANFKEDWWYEKINERAGDKAGSVLKKSLCMIRVHARDFKEVIASDVVDQQGHDDITLVVRLGEVTPIENHGKSSVVLVSYLFHYL
jgi:hypothetical protein